MADFLVAYTRTAGEEGGYSYTPRDAGGETYAGISSVFHPAWEGWEVVRSAVAQVTPIPVAAAFGASILPSSRWKEVDAILRQLPFLQSHVESFYKREFWDRLALSQFPSQSLASSVYDAAVNCGISKATLWLQQALNVTNNQGKLWEDLLEDGLFGPTTLRVALQVQRGHSGRVRILQTAFLILRGAFHIEQMRKRPDQEVFANSWLGRVARQMMELT